MMKKTILCAVFIYAALFRTQAQWTNVTSVPGMDGDYGMTFLTPITGFICGTKLNSSTTINDGYIYKTINGGITWTNPLVCTSFDDGGTPKSFVFRDLQFISSSNGYMVGKNYVFGLIGKTTDGGNTWDTLTLYDMATLEQVWFNDISTGVVAGEGFIYRTTDGGTNWTQVKEVGGTCTEIEFVSATTGFASFQQSGVSPGYVMKTTDGGITWNIVYTETGDDVTDLDFINTTTGFAVTKSGKFLTTTNAGSTWSTLTIPASDLSYTCTIQFVNSSTGYVAGLLSSAISGKIFKTTNGGVSWTSDYSQFGVYAPYSNLVIAGTTGYLFGDGLQKSTSIPSAIEEIESLSDNVSVYPNPVDEILRIGTAGENMEKCRFTIMNTTGEIITSGNYRDLERGLDVSHMPNGIYHISFISEEKILLSKKFMKN